jgi:PAS domain S-box-containing protein
MPDDRFLQIASQIAPFFHLENMNKPHIAGCESGATPSADFLGLVARFSSETMGAWLLAFIQSRQDGVILLDPAWNIVLLNQVAERMFGHSSPHACGRPLDLMLSQESRLQLERTVACNRADAEDAPAGAAQIRLQLEGLRADGQTFALAGTIAPLCGSGERFLALTVHESSDPGRSAHAASQVVRHRAVSSQHANELEKRRVSRELYDDLGQHLSVLKLDMVWLEQNLPTNSQASVGRMADMQDLLDEIIVRTKDIASGLRPPLLDDFGLLPAIKWVAGIFQKKTSIACEVDTEGSSAHLGDPVDSAIFRVVQEALLNIDKHAQASRVKISLRHDDRQLEVTIQDDGIGMSMGSENKAGCFGLVAMQERIYTLGGTISIHNREPRGLLIHASIPLGSFPTQQISLL